MPAIEVAESTFQDEWLNSVFLITNFTHKNISVGGVNKNNPNRFGIDHIFLSL